MGELDKYLIIDIQNNKEILQLILDTIPYLPGSWKIEQNVHFDNHWWSKFPNGVARFFGFDFDEKRFTWAADDFYPPTWAPVVQIQDEAQASRLMDDVYDKTHSYDSLMR
jgi:hypothetical protein